MIAVYIVTIYVKLCSIHNLFSVLQLWLQSQDIEMLSDLHRNLVFSVSEISTIKAR